MRKVTLGMLMATATVLGIAPMALASDAEVKEMISLINQERNGKGLRLLHESPALNDVSKGHSRDMVKAGFFSHESPNSGSPTDRLKAAGVRFSVAGENIAMDVSVAEAHKHLMQSPGHRRNVLLPDVSHVGIGIKRQGRHLYITQTFAKLVGAPAPAIVAAPPAVAPAPVQPIAPPLPAAPPPVVAAPLPPPAAPAAPPVIAAPILPPPVAAPPSARLPQGPIARGPEGQPEFDRERPRRRGGLRLRRVQTPYGVMCVMGRQTVAPCGYVARMVMARRARAAMMRGNRGPGGYDMPAPRQRAPRPEMPEMDDNRTPGAEMDDYRAPRRAPRPEAEPYGG